MVLKATALKHLGYQLAFWGLLQVIIVQGEAKDRQATRLAQ